MGKLCDLLYIYTTCCGILLCAMQWMGPIFRPLIIGVFWRFLAYLGSFELIGPMSGQEMMALLITRIRVLNGSLG